MVRKLFIAAAIATAALAVVPALADDKIADPAFLSDLRTIDRTATDVAEGRAGSGARLQGPARTIGLAWEQAAPILAAGDGYIVEMKQANGAIADFERGWQTSTDPRDLANEITGAVADLYDLIADPTPSDVHRLAYLDRKVVLAVDRRDWSGARGAASDLESTWDGLRDDVTKRRGGQAAATSFERASAKLLDAVKAHNRGAVIAAVPSLESAVRSVGSAF